MTGKPWFRLYSEFVTDPKIQLLAFEDQRHFVALLCLKCNGTLDSDATNQDHRERIIAKALGLDPTSAAEAKRRLLEVGIINPDWQPSKWSNRQYESDSSTARVHKYREKHAETLQKRSGNGNGTFKSRYRADTEQNRTEQRVEARASARATRLPDDFGLTEERRKVAEGENLDPQRTFDHFRDYWVSVAGAKGRRLDWDAVWRNWCRSEYSKPANGKAPANSKAASAWERLIASDGAERDDIVQRALAAVGGWQRVRMRTPFDEQKIRAEFCHAYGGA